MPRQQEICREERVSSLVILFKVGTSYPEYDQIRCPNSRDVPWCFCIVLVNLVVKLVLASRHDLSEYYSHVFKSSLVLPMQDTVFLRSRVSVMNQ